MSGYWLILIPALMLLAWWLAGQAEADWGHWYLQPLDGLNRLFCRHYHRLQGEPIPLPEQGGAIVVANHLSGLDPMLLLAASPRPLRFLIAAEEYRRFGFTWLFRAVGCIPVDRHGRPEKAFREALKALQAGEVIAIFPHGKIHLDNAPRRRLKPGAVRLAELANCPIYPVRLDGMQAQGEIFTPVFRRAHARLASRPPRQCAVGQAEDCLQRLEQDLAPLGVTP
ncbi:MAG: 1-acyl-sn-glycerol-3-phosphate acyltransferase [Chromatiales bacterium]|nr:1-acyl-sn-glycerol-3-phosphate acyltransferase [Gammaproteobacteria bacterium]MBW6477319.1 1-acyl-sn-glycerol-3-phosphate acyltransferase [Chromatiales bacterium]